MCYLGVDRTIFHPSTVASHGEHILHISNDEPRKNVDRIVAAYQSLQPTIGQPLLLKLPVDRFRQEAGDIRVITNRLSDEGIARLYRKAAVLVFPSLYEGFGLPVIEAQANGVPVICSDIPVFHEVAADSAAFLNKDASAADMHAIISNKDLRDSLIRKGKENVSRYSWKKLSAQMMTIYQQQLIK